MKMNVQIKRKIDTEIKNEILKIILNRISNFKGQIFLFGSYAQNKATNYSDIDICLKLNKEIELDVLTNLKNDFINSNIPYRLDIVDYFRMDESFKNIAFKEVEIWYQTN